MKKRLCTLASLFVISNAMATGIPVFDGAAATNFITQWTQMLKDYQMLTQQYNQAVQIYDQAVSTYDSMTGSRGFGMLHHSQNWIRLMPESLQENFNRTFSDGFSALSSRGRFPQPAHKHPFSSRKCSRCSVKQHAAKPNDFTGRPSVRSVKTKSKRSAAKEGSCTSHPLVKRF